MTALDRGSGARIAGALYPLITISGLRLRRRAELSRQTTVHEAPFVVLASQGGPLSFQRDGITASLTLNDGCARCKSGAVMSDDRICELCGGTGIVDSHACPNCGVVLAAPPGERPKPRADRPPRRRGTAARTEK
jgi:hypothetical protein